MNLPQATEPAPLTDTVAQTRSRRGTFLLPALWGLAAVLTIGGVMFIPGFPGNPAQDSGADALVTAITGKAGQPDEPRSELQRLTDQVARLTADRDKLIARLEILERQIGAKPLAAALMSHPDVPVITGSISRVTDTTTTASRRESFPDSHDPMAMPDGPVRRIAFAIDLGSAPSVDRLKDRWLATKELFKPTLDKLEPKVAFGRTKDGVVELRLLAGPFQNAQSAIQACAALQTSAATCEPRPFEGESLPKS